MRYPIRTASTLPGSGSAIYLHLLENIDIPARLTHKLWYNGCTKLKDNPKHPFQGYYPIGETMAISYGGSPIADHTFSEDDRNPVFVEDLSMDVKNKLGILPTAARDAKVYNPYYRLYDDLPRNYQKDNELPALSLAKSIASFLNKDPLFTEVDVVDMLTSAIMDANSDSMIHILHGNHVSWCASRFLQLDTMDNQIKKNFYSQNDLEFFLKDIGTIMPSILYVLALLGSSPKKAITHLSYDLWGINKAAEEMENCMKPIPEPETA